MALLRPLTNKTVFIAEVILWYILCSCTHVFSGTYNIHFFCHDFSNPGELEWFVYDLCNVWGLFLLAHGAYVFIEDKLIKTIFGILTINFIYEMFDLIVLNNEYNLKGLIWQNILIVSLVIHAIIKYKKT